ncbi:DUF4811 domain-containing protein [Lactiplantibacillus modestisalitolerans]|uniref:DUF4811 domain-containing protein n=1 Tax=Lactiplantibacillus modestisalitolerans TaxID=1457219 RepID=A0ABV5WQZ6_9LACO|nr:DUF4811 domain-containing protein [Lactiplantibacillus modestisalitolerans]
MMIGLLIVATFVFSGVMIFARQGQARLLSVIISGLVIAGSLVALVLNDNYHWGMQRVTTTRTETLTPLKTTQTALGIQPLGTGNEHVIVYRVKGTTKPRHTVRALSTTTQLNRGTKAQVKVTTTRWQYRNHFAQLCFDLGKDTANNVVSRHYQFTVPTNWQTTTIQATK